MLNLFSSVILGVIAIFFRIQAKSWLAPGSIFAGYWFLAVVFALLVAPDYYPVTSGAIWWIIISVVSLGIGSMIGNTINKSEKKTKPNNKLNPKKLKRTVVTFSLLGILGVFFLISSLGYGFGIYFSLNTLKALSSSVAEAKYLENYKPPFIYNFLLCFTYSSAYLGGMLYVLNKSKWSFFPFIPILLAAVVMTTKALILFPVFMWLSGFLATRVITRETKIPVRFVFRLSIAVGLLTVIFVVMLMMRYKMYSIAGLGMIYERLTIYYVGYLSGFSQWFDKSAYQLSNYGMGNYTLAGISDLLGISVRGQGIFSEMVPLGPYQTNIYTLFRYLIQDFTLPGSLVVLFLIGVVSGKVYQSTLHGSYIGLPILALFYTQVLFSNTTTIFGYNTLILTAFILMVYLGKNGISFSEKKTLKLNHNLY